MNGNMIYIDIIIHKHLAFMLLLLTVIRLLLISIFNIFLIKIFLFVWFYVSCLVYYFDFSILVTNLTITGFFLNNILNIIVVVVIYSFMAKLFGKFCRSDKKSLWNSWTFLLFLPYIVYGLIFDFSLSNSNLFWSFIERLWTCSQ